MVTDQVVDQEDERSLRVLAETLERMDLGSIPAARLLLKSIRCYLAQPAPGDLAFCQDIFQRLDRGLKRKIAQQAVHAALLLTKPPGA